MAMPNGVLTLTAFVLLGYGGSQVQSTDNMNITKSLTTAAASGTIRFANKSQRRRETNASLWQHRRETNATLWQHRRENSSSRHTNKSLTSSTGVPTAQLSHKEHGRQRKASATAKPRPRFTSPSAPPTDKTVQRGRIGPRHQRNKKTNSSLRRHRRYDYEEIYQWQEEEGDYETQEYFAEVEPPFLQRLMLNWQTAAPRIILLGTPVVVMCMCCCGCLYAGCKLWIMSCKEMSPCCPVRVKEVCMYIYSDPMYERVKKLGKAFGVHISFTTYEKIMHHYGADQYEQFGFGFSPF